MLVAQHGLYPEVPVVKRLPAHLCGTTHTSVTLRRTAIRWSWEESPTSENRVYFLSHLKAKRHIYRMAAWWDYGVIRTLVYWCQECKRVGPYGKTLWQFLIKWNLHQPLWPGNVILRYLPKRNENLCPQRDLYTNIYSHMQKKNNDEKSWQEKGWVIWVCPWYGTLLDNKKESNSDPCSSRKESQNIMLHERSQNKRGYSNNSIYMNRWMTRTLATSGGWREDRLVRSLRECFTVIEMFTFWWGWQLHRYIRFSKLKL